MSYTIVYDRCFVKTSRGIIPMMLAGSNNCTMLHFGKEILERQWFCPRQELIEKSAEEILERASELYSDCKTDQVWKSAGKWVSSRQVRTWYANGVKNACGLEDIALRNPAFSVHCILFRWNRDGSTEEKMQRWCQTTDKLESWLDEAQAEVANGKGWEIQIGFDTLKPLVKPESPNKKWTGSVVLRSKGRRPNYVSALKENDRYAEVSWTSDIDEAIKFSGTDEVFQKAGACLNRFGLKIVKYQPKEAKQFTITKESCNGTVMFITHSTRNHIYFSFEAEQAKRFATENEAKRWIESKRGRYAPNKLNELLICKI